MIRLTGIKLDTAYPCDACGALKNVVTEIKCIRPSDKDRHKGIVTKLYLCYRCRDALHTHIGKHIMLSAGPY